MPVFPSVEWLKAVADVSMHDERYRHFGRCDAIVGLRIGDQCYSLTFDVFDITDIHEASEAELRDADFVLTMTRDQWIDLVKATREHGSAPLDHTLNSLDLKLPNGLASNLTGDGYRLDKFFRFNQSLQCFFDNAARVETTYTGVPTGAAAGDA
jgi:hypothetical protein